jgi:hypothetical protein
MGECYRQNHPDRTNLRILSFADNKDLHGRGFSESLTSVPFIDGTQLEMKIKSPAHTLLQQCVPMHSRFQTPIPIRLFFLAVLVICSFFTSSLLFCLHIVILFFKRRQTNEVNERANERTATRLSSSHVHLLLTITYFLPLASSPLLLTLDRLRR